MEKQIEPTPRIKALREDHLSHKHCLDVERAAAVTEVFKETEGLPPVLRRAKAFKRICEQKSIQISENELIVGNIGREPRTGLLDPEFAHKWIEDELDSLPTRRWDPWLVTEEQKKLLSEEILPYWKGKSLEDFHRPRCPDYMLRLCDHEVIYLSGKGRYPIGEVVPSYENIIFRKGFYGIKKEAEKKLAELKPHESDSFEKKPFLQAITIVCDGIHILSKRYAELAKKMAKDEANPRRKAELQKIAKICYRVPSNPPRSFHEALQALWFVQIGFYLEANALGYSPGRFDQYMWPYYKKDLETGKITKKEAQELLDCLWIKLSEANAVFEEVNARWLSGYNSFVNLNVGGVKPNGEDATNELSYMCIQATMDTRLALPALTVIIHKKTPEEFLKKVCELVKMGLGHPSIINHDNVIKLLLGRGVPVSIEEARGYAIQGCVEPAIQGKTHMWSFSDMLGIATAVELALNNGSSMLTGELLGVETGDPAKFGSFEEVKEAVKKQLAFMVRVAVEHEIITEKLHAELMPVPFVSAVVEGCVENGREWNAYGSVYNFGPPIDFTGIADVADSLAAIKKLVFETKRITMSELCNVLRENFEGHEDIRQMLLNDAPKYGNDDDYVDLIAKEIADFGAQEAGKYRTDKGVPLATSITPITANVSHGTKIAALPSGRKARTPLAEGCSPKQGMDVNGPTAALKSIGKLNHEGQLVGTQLNMKLDPVFLEGDRGLTNLAALIRTHNDLGIHHVQFNVVSEKTLRAAQENPEQYRDLMVRVSGYCAYFVDLDRQVQEDIIGRTAHARMR